MLTTAIILAGGFGTRLQSVVKDVPKPMAPINEKPFLHYQLLFLKHHGIKNVVFSVGYLHETIEAFFGDKYLDLNISYAHEKTPLGTGGGIRLAMEKCNTNEVLVLNGDSFFDFDLKAFYYQHQINRSNFSLALRKINNAARFGTIETDKQHFILSFKEKTGLESPGIINTGVYILNKKVFFENSPNNKAFSIEKDFFEINSSKLNITGFVFEGYFIDIGLPEEFKQAQHDFKEFKY